MLVPSSFVKYSSAAMDSQASIQKDRRRSMRKTSTHSSPTRPQSPQGSVVAHATSEPVSIPSANPSNAAAQQREHMGPMRNVHPHKSASLTIGRRKSSNHDADALPPAVAALLAVTAIPPRRPHRYRTKPGSSNRRISIEELISEWKCDESLKTSYGSTGSAALSILLEDDDREERSSGSRSPFLSARSASSDSMPSLESDDRSELSVGSPSTPESLRSRKSDTNLFKKEKSRSLPASVDCAFDHPLIPSLAIEEYDEGDEFVLPTQKQTPATPKARSSFKSNLTASLQSLKEAAVNSISSLSRTGPMLSHSRTSAAPPMDDMLWSHPFLFPRLSSEVRPMMDGLPTLAERRYLNPAPLTFEEQEAPFQEALHAPYLAETAEDAPTIQMQTYNRSGRKRSSQKRSVANPNSEAGRALLGAPGVRQREVRENSNFLRVVVLEMNMRREGKLEQGRARIWLPPRDASAAREDVRGVPKRWVGESA